jgi:arabinose-5-phosphate isomerase
LDKQGKLAGVFTDGDLRRTLDSRVDINETTIGQLMSSGAKTIDPTMLGAAALLIMEENEISSLVVLDDSGALTGVVHLKDLLHAGIA